eukprot:Rhum_TRINITY_DN14970_c8_g4::Rhum_TRINITY_DN14970_c8_g4_i3::g.130343::m.130343
MEIDGQIDAWVPIVGQVKIRNVIPQKFEEYPLEATRCKVDKKVSCASASIYGDTGYMYRRMDLNYDLEHAPEYPLPFCSPLHVHHPVLWPPVYAHAKKETQVKGGAVHTRGGGGQETRAQRRSWACDMQNKNGRTPLHLAAIKGCVETVKIL